MFTIIQDTREQIPLNFSFYPECDNVIKKAIKTGDYSILGYEDIVFIERKRSSAELANNFGFDSKRFYSELDRTKDLKWKFIVCEFSINTLLEFPKYSGIPREKWSNLKFNGNALYTLVKNVEKKYNINFIFCDNSPEVAAQEVINICKKVVEYYEVSF